MIGPRPQCYIPSHKVIGPLVLAKIFEGFLLYMGVAAILVMWPRPRKQTSVPPTHGGSTWNLASIGPAVLEKKIFENGGWTTDGWMDDGACLYYKFTNDPKGSGELKIHKQVLWFLHFAHHHLVLDICMKFHEDIFKGFKVILRTPFCHRNCYLQSSKGHNSKMHIQELRFLCSACRPVLVNISMKFHEDILNGFKVTEQTRFCDRQTDNPCKCLPTLKVGDYHSLC